MQQFRHLLRMALWARRPPGARRVKLMLAVLAGCLALVAVERVLGWPDWLTIDPAPKPGLRR